MKFAKKLFLCVVLLFFLVWGSALIKCEILTTRHIAELEGAYQSNTMLGAPESVHVLSYDGERAEVYYIEEGKTVAHVLKFEKTDDGWAETAWNTVWSEAGSASNVIWPYWWHFRYGGF